MKHSRCAEARFARHPGTLAVSMLFAAICVTGGAEIHGFSDPAFETCAEAPPLAPALRNRESYFGFLDAFLDTPHFRLHYSTLPGRLELPGEVLDIGLAGSLALVARGGAGLSVVDLTSPGRPRLVASVDTPGRAERVAITSTLAYVADGDSGLAIVDFANPGEPRLVGRLRLRGTTRSVIEDGMVALAVGSGGLAAIDVSDPSTPVELGSVDIAGTPMDIVRIGSSAHVAAGDSGLYVVDVSSPRTPVITGRRPTAGPVWSIAQVADSLLCVTIGNSGLLVVDAHSPMGPPLGWQPIDGARRVIADSSLVYVVAGRSVHVLDPTSGHFESAGFSRLPVTAASSGQHLFVALQGFGLETVAVLPIDVPPAVTLRPVRDMIHGWPDTSFRDSLAGALERAHNFFVDDLGMKPPLPDGTVGGGFDLVDCYIYHIPEGEARAWASFDDPTDSDCPRGQAGYCAMDNELVTSAEQAKRILAHEVFHVFQYRYGNMPMWFVESTASWAERFFVDSDLADPDVRCMLQQPYIPLWEVGTSRCHMYGVSLFWHFTEDRIHSRFVQLALERMCDLWSPVDAIRIEMSEQGRELNTALIEFAIWNNATGDYDDGHHYRRRVPWPVAMQAEHATYPVENATVAPSLLAQPAAANYIRFKGPGRRDTLHVRFNSDPLLREWRAVAFVATRAPNRHEEQILYLDESGGCEFTVADWPAYDSVTMIVANGDTTGARLASSADYAFTYDAVEAGAAALTAVAPPMPNPFATTTAIQLRLASDGLHVRSAVYEIGGRHIRQIIDEILPRGNRTLVWDGTDDNGKPLPQGVYFLRLETGLESVTYRMVMIR